MLQVKAIDIRLFNMRTRLPFRYGIVTLRACPHLFLKLTLDIDSRAVNGIAADHLPPKWFTKNPQTPYEEDINDMLAGIRHAADQAVMAGAQASVFSLSQAVYASQKLWGEQRQFPPLLYGHGVSLVERAAIEALCRATQTTFATAVRENLLGIELSGDLAGTKPADWLPPQPLQSITARHTVGLVDPLTDDEIPASERVNNGLPQSLEACIRYYGLKHFKLKIAGNVEQDAARLKRIFNVIALNVQTSDWRYTLDGNENYTDMASFAALWESLQADDALREPLSHLIFIEQPLHRDVALSREVKSALNLWIDRPPIIIDESDGHPGALQQALDCGYVGTSHKNCKGVIKGITSACLLAHHRRTQPRRKVLMSGEDLSNVGPVSLLQDLAVCAMLGIHSVERNSQHYFKGLSMHSRELQEQMLTHHGDLYRRHETGDFATLRITDGQIAVGSVVNAPFGVGFEPDLEPFTPVERWRFDPG